MVHETLESTYPADRTGATDIFQHLLDSFPDMIHSVDDRGRIVYANRTAESLLGYKRSELIGMDVHAIYADEVQNAMDAGFTALRQEGNMRVESLLKTKSGETLPVEIRSFGIYDDTGQFLKTFSIVRDIRKIKALQNELIHAGRLAAIGELASGVAHDIGNPLTVILLANEVILRALAESSKCGAAELQRIRNSAHDIRRASGSIEKLSTHLRTFSRGMAEAYQPVDLYEALADALFITGSKLIKSGVVVENPTVKGRHFVNGCANQLEQIFVNLVSNACDAMQQSDERRLTINVSGCVDEGRDCWCCDVQDTGCGIPAENTEAVFRSFFTTKPKGQGTGLGLAICAGILREHEGRIELDLERRTGTTFRVLLPAIDAPIPGIVGGIG